MAEDIDRVKAEFETKISGYDAAGQAAAKTAWNATLDKVRTILVGKVAAITALKAADVLINSKLSTKASMTSTANQDLKNNVVTPASKMLAPYSSKSLSKLKSEISLSGQGSNNYASTASSISNRNAFNKGLVDVREKELNENINTIDLMKFQQ